MGLFDFLNLRKKAEQQLIQRVNQATNAVKLGLYARLVHRYRELYPLDFAKYLAAAVTNEALSDPPSNEQGREFVDRNGPLIEQELFTLANDMEVRRVLTETIRARGASMTADEYFDSHIPHRLNLLISFRTRYSGRPSPHALSPEAYRDLFRCAKDICFLMTRFFCGELGVYFDEGAGQIESAQRWQSRFGSTRVQPLQLRHDPRYADLCQMYQAANHAVAHIDSQRVYHSFRFTSDDQRIIAAIDWLEELVRDHIYEDAGRDLTTSMSLPANVMT